MQDVYVKEGDGVVKEQLIGTNGTGGGLYPAHCHLERIIKKLPSWSGYVNGWSKEKVKEYFSEPTATDMRVVFPTFHHLGYNWLDWYGKGYHPGKDLNGPGGGNSDLGDPIHSPCDGKVVYKNENAVGWGNLLVIEVAEKPVFTPKYLKGIDVSHWQGEKAGKTLDWSEVPPFDFVVMKATESTSHIDTEFRAWQIICRGQERKIGYYHFARYGDAKAEAEFFVDTVDLREGEFMVLDWELKPQNSPNAVQWCKTFLERVEELTETPPLIYMGNRDWNAFDWSPVLDKYKLWIARYGTNSGNVEWKFKPSTDEWIIWQYTSNGNVQGIQGRVDMNIAKELPVGKVEQEEPDNSLSQEDPNEYKESLMKPFWKSKTIQLAVIQAVVGVLAIALTEYPELGWLVILKSIADFVLRYVTTKPVSIK